MKVLLAEYTAARDPALAPEGRAMLDVLTKSFTACGYEVVLPGPGDFYEELVRLASTCDMGLVIAPDALLSRFSLPIEQHCHTLGCGSMNVAVCANKRSTEKILRAHGVPVPPPAPAGGKHIVKPVTGCDAQGVRLTTDAPKKDELAQGIYRRRTLLGQPSCEPGSGRGLSVLLRQPAGRARDQPAGCCWQTMTVRSQYLGGETPMHPAREQEII